MSVALDPSRSVVVEACAGSGKTWLLASRLLRVLLAGVAPSKILAITYTRKAAAEIEARVFEWLRDLARLDEAGAIDFLCQRGLSRDEAVAALPRARGLFEAVVLADQPITITTFHGWFVRLVQAAPLEAGLAGLALADAAEPLLEEAFARLAARAGRAPQGELAQALVALFREPGWFSARGMLGNFINRRAEWQAMGAAVEAVLEDLRARLGVTEPPSALQKFFALPGLHHDCESFACLLRANETATDLKHAAQLEAGLAATDLKVRCAALFAVFLTQKGTARARNMSKALEKRLGANAERYCALHVSLSSQLLELHVALAEEAAYALNRAGLLVGDALAKELSEHKSARRVMDFTDLETYADRLLASEDAAFLQARLDARYSQILLDEFQDTNPLQWRILRGWFDAYGPGQQAPQVFMVGDPRQSIYRFRRAEPRIFSAAGEYLCENFQAERIYNDITRRNAPAVVEVVNAIFEPAGFRSQSAFNVELPGRVELLPLVARGQGAKAAEDEGAALRDPLAQMRAVVEDERRAREAALVASKIAEWVGRLLIDHEGKRRVAQYGDFMLLTRNRTHLAIYERALRDANIPYFSGSRGGLLDTLEAQDMAALLGALANGADDLKLAHVLRSPVFDLDDAALMAIARFGQGHWWARIEAMVAEGAAPAIARAHRLLSRWRELAAHWPVHDVLSAIYAEADVLARYRAHVPALMWPAVRANLEAFLRLSLEHDGGRYPSLTRFNDELKRLREAAEEAPDEGLIEGAEDSGRVRILTIHAAKGLEAPLVWLIDANGVSPSRDGHDVLIEWPPGSHAPTHFSLYGNKASRGRAREALFAAEEAAAEREELNLLYVAITRARQFFFASGIEPGRSSSRRSFYGRIEEGLQRLAGGAPAEEAPPGGAHGEDMALEALRAVLPASQLATLPRRSPLGVGKRREQDTLAQRYGTALHLALEHLTENLPLPAGFEPAVLEHARRILDSPGLKMFFDAAYFLRAENEIEFALPDGNTGRIDRLVETQDGMWVLDYKAGRGEDAPLETYRAQLARYREAVSLLHPGARVRCALIFGDAQWVEV